MSILVWFFSMCDTLVALPEYTSNRHMIFAKNSDREPDEAQTLVRFPRMEQMDEWLQCTYISIPQVRETFEVLLSKPFHMWGAEMGLNEFGLCIGNEAIFTNIPFEKENKGLTGMDMLRLALERCLTAKEGLEYIIWLLKTYGQDACGGYKNKDFFYHNSFIIADPKEAYVLETAGKSWAYKKIDKYYSISNGLSLGTDYDKYFLSDEKRSLLHDWRPKQNPFHFASYFSDILYTHLSKSKIRQECSMRHLANNSPGQSVGQIMAYLRSHDCGEETFHPQKANTACICMHATGITNPSSTTGSMVAELRQQKPSTLWMTGTSNPCLSVYIPFFLGTNTLQEFRQPSEKPDGSLWWLAETVHQWICQDYGNRKRLVAKELSDLQSEFLEKEKELIENSANLSNLAAFSDACLRKVMDFYQSTINNLQIPHDKNFLFENAGDNKLEQSN